MTSPLLRVDNLSHRIDGKTILAGVSFAMEEAEIRAVIGPNGAGKSTLMRCLAGIVPPGSGRIEIAGADLRSLSRRDLARSVCYIPQLQGTAPPFSVREYVAMGRYVHTGFWDGLTRRDAGAVDAAMAMAGVEDLADRVLPTLSGGERQLVEIACGLAQEAALLILDEPATFLDPGHQGLLLSLLGRLNRERRLSILVVTHDVNVAMLSTTRTLALRRGGAVFDGPSAELGGGDVLREVFGMDFLFFETGRGGRVALPAALAEAGDA